MPRNARTRLHWKAWEQVVDDLQTWGLHDHAALVEEILEWVREVSWRRRYSGEMREYASRDDAVQAALLATEAFQEERGLDRLFPRHDRNLRRKLLRAIESSDVALPEDLPEELEEELPSELAAQ